MQLEVNEQFQNGEIESGFNLYKMQLEGCSGYRSMMTFLSFNLYKMQLEEFSEKGPL